MNKPRVIPPPPPAPGSNRVTEQKFVYVDNYASTCDLNARIKEDGWHFVSMIGAQQFVLVLLERTVKKEDTHE